VFFFFFKIKKRVNFVVSNSIFYLPNNRLPSQPTNITSNSSPLPKQSTFLNQPKQQPKMSPSTYSGASSTSSSRRFRDFFPDLRTEAMKIADQKNREQALAQGYKERIIHELYTGSSQRGMSIDSRRS